MDKYMYFILGIILGISIAIYFSIKREEKIEKTIKINQKVFSTKKLDITMEAVVERIKLKINEVKRELTEDEKNDIIVQCYKEQFKNNE